MKKAIQELGEGVHSLLAGLVLVAVTAFVMLGKMTVDQWSDMVKWTMGIFGCTHVGTLATRRRQPAAAPQPPAAELPKAITPPLA